MALHRTYDRESQSSTGPAPLAHGNETAAATAWRAPTDPGHTSGCEMSATYRV